MHYVVLSTWSRRGFSLIHWNNLRQIFESMVNTLIYLYGLFEISSKYSIETSYLDTVFRYWKVKVPVWGWLSWLQKWQFLWEVVAFCFLQKIATIGLTNWFFRTHDWRRTESQNWTFCKLSSKGPNLLDVTTEVFFLQLKRGCGDFLEKSSEIGGESFLT